MVSIYALVNPFNEQLFYVGATKQSLEMRLLGHRADRFFDGKNIRHKIIREIINKGGMPEIFELDRVGFEEASFWEDFYLHYFKSLGFYLNQPKSTYTLTYFSKSFLTTLPNNKK